MGQTITNTLETKQHINHGLKKAWDGRIGPKLINLGFFCLLLFSILGCSNNSTYHIRTIKYVDNFRIISSDGQIKDDASSFKISFLKDYEMYEVATTIFKVEKTIVNGNNIVNELYPSKDTVYKYFVIQKGRATGLQFDSLKAEVGHSFKRDSLINALAIFKENMQIYNLDLGKPLRSFYDKNLDMLVESYYTKNSKDDADSVYRYYNSKLNGISFSLSDSLDRINKSKLVRTDFVYLGNTRQNMQDNARRTEGITSIEEVHPKDEKGFIALFRLYERHLKTHGSTP